MLKPIEECVDPVLARRMRDCHERVKILAPRERIVYTDWLSTVCNVEKLSLPARVAKLECGHQTVTRNKSFAPCYLCLEMILNGEDYDAFRNRC